MLGKVHICVCICIYICITGWVLSIGTLGIHMLPRHLLKKIMHDHSGYVRIMMLISDHTGDDVDVDEK